jgi:hypothetical protein
VMHVNSINFSSLRFHYLLHVLKIRGHVKYGLSTDRLHGRKATCDSTFRSADATTDDVYGSAIVRNGDN